MQSATVLFRCFLIASALVLAGCNGAPTTKDAVVKSDDYEYVTPLGSNIPVLVRKGQRPDTASPTASMSGDQATNAIHGGGGQMPASKGTP